MATSTDHGSGGAACGAGYSSKKPSPTTTAPIDCLVKDHAAWNLFLYGFCSVSDDIVNLCPCCRSTNTAFGLLTPQEQSAVTSRMLVHHLTGVPVKRDILVDGLLVLAIAKVRDAVLPGSDTDDGSAGDDAEEAALVDHFRNLTLEAGLQCRLPADTEALVTDLLATGRSPSRDTLHTCIEAVLASVIGSRAQDYQLAVSEDSQAVFCKQLTAAYGSGYMFPDQPRLTTLEQRQVDRLGRVLSKGRSSTLPRHTDTMLDNVVNDDNAIVCRVGRCLAAFRGPLALLHKPVHVPDLPLSLPDPDMRPISNQERKRLVKWWNGLSPKTKTAHLTITRLQLAEAMHAFPMWLSFRAYIRLHRATMKGPDSGCPPSDGWFHKRLVGSECLTPAGAAAADTGLTAVTDGSDVLFSVKNVKSVTPFPAVSLTPPRWMTGMTGSVPATRRALGNLGRCVTCSMVKLLTDGVTWLVWNRVATAARATWAAAAAASEADRIASLLLLEEEEQGVVSQGKSSRRQRQRQRRQKAKKGPKAEDGAAKPEPKPKQEQKHEEVKEEEVVVEEESKVPEPEVVAPVETSPVEVTVASETAESETDEASSSDSDDSMFSGMSGSTHSSTSLKSASSPTPTTSPPTNAKLAIKTSTATATIPATVAIRLPKAPTPTPAAAPVSAITKTVVPDVPSLAPPQVPTVATKPNTAPIRRPPGFEVFLGPISPPVHKPAEGVTMIGAADGGAFAWGSPFSSGALFSAPAPEQSRWTTPRPEDVAWWGAASC